MVLDQARHRALDNLADDAARLRGSLGKHGVEMVGYRPDEIHFHRAVLGVLADVAREERAE